jgi:predicted P-loop ATPase/GTPase
MTDLTEENLKACIIEIQKYMKETRNLIAIKPTKVLYCVADLEKIGFTHDDVVNMIKKNHD